MLEMTKFLWEVFEISVSSPTVLWYLQLGG